MSCNSDACDSCEIESGERITLSATPYEMRYLIMDEEVLLNQLDLLQQEIPPLCDVIILQSVMTEGVIRFEQLSDRDDQVRQGDKVVTSAISSKYLPDIPIGFIDSIETAANNMTKFGTITPAVDFRHLQEVLVILETKQQIPEEE